MNRTYRLVFNKALGLVQVVSELANCRGKKSSGRSTTSQAHIGFSENLSAPFKLKAIAIASALTVGSLLTIGTPFSFAQPINNSYTTTETITNGVSITGVNGVAGVDGNDNGEPGGNGGAAVLNGNGTITTLTNNSSITGGAGGAGGNGLERYSNGRYGGAAGHGIDNTYGTITTLNNNSNSIITGGAGGAGGNGGFAGGNGRSGGHGVYNYGGTITTLNNNGSITGGAGGAGGAGAGGGGGSIPGESTQGGYGIYNGYYGTITTLNNNGSITGGAGASGIYNGYSEINTLNNNGSITGGAGVAGSINESRGMGGGSGIYNGYSGTITTLNNNGSITGGAGGAGFAASNGDGGDGGDGIFNYGSTITTLTNNGSITGGNGGAAGAAAAYYADGGGAGGNGIKSLYGTITSLTNNGSIIGGDGGNEGNGDVTYNGPGNGGAGVINGFGSTITTLNNNGSITGGNGGRRRVGGTSDGNGGSGVQNEYGATITTLNNMGSITWGAGADNDGFGISNFGSIVTLSNAQGGDSLTPATTALTYTGNLPADYNIIIKSFTNYGQLFASSVTGTMSFGISNLSVASNTIYNGIKLTSVLTGIDPTSVTINGYITSFLRVSSLDNRYSGNLVYNGYGIWDLDILSAPIAGPSALDTQSSLHSLAPKLRGVFSSQLIATNFANMNTYDCDLFDAKGVCVSVGGQQTYVDNPSSNMTSTVVVAGYKVSPNIRIGGFLNQNINNNTVSGVHISNANPLMGVFAVWNQKEDRLGYQVKIANAYQDKDVTTTRDVIDSSEAGIGRTNLNTQSYVGELSYAFLVNEDKTLVRPYAALRYTHIKQDGYTEQTSAGVTAPLTYAALADRSTTALVGIKLNHKLAENVNLTGSFGIEQDLHHQVDNLTATGVSSLTSENFNNSIKRTRPVASIGAYYMPVKNQRISADIYYQQMPFQSTGSATAYVNYTIGF